MKRTNPYAPKSPSNEQVQFDYLVYNFFYCLCIVIFFFLLSACEVFVLLFLVHIHVKILLGGNLMLLNVEQKDKFIFVFISRLPQFCLVPNVPVKFALESGIIFV